MIEIGKRALAELLPRC